jgi:hypothetical protein
VPVEGVGGTGPLGGVASLANRSSHYKPGQDALSATEVTLRPSARSVVDLDLDRNGKIGVTILEFPDNFLRTIDALQLGVGNQQVNGDRFM